MNRVSRVTVVEATRSRAIPAGRYARHPGMLLVLTDAEGRAGIGEASPLAGYSPDDLGATHQALSALEARAIASLLEPVGPGDFSGACRALSGLLDDGLPAARFALETACLDLSCRLLEKSPTELLGLGGPESLTVASLVAQPSEAGLERARVLVAQGYRTLKVKLWRGDAQEIEQLRQLAELPVRLRVDANRRLDPERVRRMAPALQGLGVEFFEEPFPNCTARDLASGSLDLALDESLQGLDASGLDSLLDLTGARVVVLKPMVLGGFARCLSLARRAAGRGVQVVVSHTFDGPVALHATSLLALAVQSAEFAAGLAPHAGLEQWPDAALPSLTPGSLNRAAFERPWLSPEGVLEALSSR
jgi:o-succinylbenzoate synthase